MILVSEMQKKLNFTGLLGMAIIGGITGGLYGIVLWLLAFYLTESYHYDIIVWSVGVFSVMGMLFGNFIIDFFLAFLHFIWGILLALSYFAGYGTSTYHEKPPIYESDSSRNLKAFALLGFGTGLVITCWWFF